MSHPGESTQFAGKPWPEWPGLSFYITTAFDGKLPTRPNAIQKILIVRPERCPREALILFARGEGTKIIRRRKEGGFRIS